MLIQNATGEVLSARRRHQRGQADRDRFRGLVDSIDHIILACEETHLLSIKKCPADLRERQMDVLLRARRAVLRSSCPEAIAVVDEQVAREVRKVTEVMDSLWIVQEVIFDLMLPWRSERHDADRDESGPNRPRVRRVRPAA